MSYDKCRRARGGAGLSALAAALLLAACGGGGGGEPPSPPPPPPPPPPVTDPVGIDKALLRQQVEVFVAEQRAKIEPINCSQSQTGPCEQLKDIRFSQGQALPVKLRADQTILLIDDGIGHAATLRYRSRMLGYYRVSESSGLVEPHDPVIPSTPRWGAELLRAIDGFQYRDASGQQRPSFVPADWLRALRPLLSGHRDFAMVDRVPHGNMVLAQLVEANPQAGFVVLDPIPINTVMQAHRASACAKDWAALELGVRQMAQSLNTVLQRHGVDYVNLSGGLDTSNLPDSWAALACGSALSAGDAQGLIMAFRPLYSALFESPGVLGVQAAGVMLSPTSHPLEVLPLANRVRVSLFHPATAQLPADGVTGAQRPAVLEPNADDRRWIDVFISTGMMDGNFPPRVNAAPPLITDSVYGLDLGPLFHATTSWLAPQALNRLIHLKQQLAPTMAPEAPLDAALIQRMKDALTPMGCSWAPEDGGRCKLQDPAWHRQQELFRQGWLSADWRWE
ncbi:hypothetical protein OOZ63_06700 [Paucibacter sp. PLA-PC-4]|uniref:hypothetical protein n=1 Tax=Paucibacter sp. PLA-PC-4 TaxID=2993655 RepID=UPI0022488E95|nr:hypothetical protein [Paucibacter sp. PLA-PC-4]MCX2861527.1 hypothetical protein [Paucibacter sp. PLA-PC-4]